MGKQEDGNEFLLRVREAHTRPASQEGAAKKVPEDSIKGPRLQQDGAD